MQVVRTIALVVAVCSACVAAQDTSSPPPPATNNNPMPTTPAPSSTPPSTPPSTPASTPPSSTQPRPATPVTGPVANVTTDTTGATATVQINPHVDSVAFEIAGTKTNVKSADPTNDLPAFAADAKPKVTVLVSTGTSTLRLQTLSSDIVTLLELRSNDDQRATTIQLTATNGFADLTKLSSLSFQNLDFYKDAVNLTVPPSLAYLKIDRSNARDVALTVSGSDAINLNKVDFPKTEFTSLPYLLYQRKYSEAFEVNNLNFASSGMSTKLSPAEYANALHNLANATKFVLLSPSCENLPNRSVTDAGPHIVCNDTSRSGIRPFGQSNVVLDPTPVPSFTPTPAPTHRGSNSNTTLTVVVVVIAVVAAVLAYFVARRYFCTATSSLSRSPRLNERMITKDETQGTNKLSFISSDDALRQIRLEQQDVSVTKSVGTGRLWVGDYAGRKVMIKRIEAESSDSYATKALITQARSLASLSHPNIVTLIGVTWVQGTDFGVVSEFMEKGTLKAVLMDLDADFDLQSKLHMCLDIAQALKYLHSSTNNMYMRRLTSRKVLVNGAIECKLNLFECHPCTTKIEYPEVFGAGELAWQAPELITRTGVLDPRKINMFSLGVLIGEIMTRVAPYQSAVDAVGNTLADLELAKRIRRQERLMPHENRREFTELPSALRDMVERCLSYQPLSRPTADEVVACLESVKNYSERVGSTTSL